MNRLILLFGVLLPLAAYGGGVENASPLEEGGNDSKSAYVVVDRREPAFTVFTGVSKEMNEEQVDKIRSDVAKDSSQSILAWSVFKATVGDLARSTMLRNDYPNFRIAAAIVCLVAKEPGAPWGLTWNGGIALTFRDYEHTRATYRRFEDKPAQYRAITDPRLDPVNPGGFLPAFGCL